MNRILVLLVLTAAAEADAATLTMDGVDVTLADVSLTSTDAGLIEGTLDGVGLQTVTSRPLVVRLRLAPGRPPLVVGCCGHRPHGRPGPPVGSPAARELDAHQDRLQHALEASGEGWVSTTRLRGATYLRAGILNTQSTAEDVDELLDVLRRLARDD